MTTQVPRILRHPVAMIGSWLTTFSAVLFVLVFALELLGFHANPYVGIVIFLIIPALFVLGLLMIPIGVRLERRREAATGNHSTRPAAPMMAVPHSTAQ